MLNAADEKKQLCLRKRWKYTKSNGEVVIIRGVLEKIVGWVQRFKEIGDVAVQFNPTSASLPWAAVRFLLQITVGEVQLFDCVVNDLVCISLS